jgi:IclR family transcriptional regulator, pca regulon regulatory protein
VLGPALGATGQTRRPNSSTHDGTESHGCRGTVGRLRCIRILNVARVATRRIMTVGITVGTRFPAFATAMGRVLLSALPPNGLDDYFARSDLTPPTPRAVHDEASLREILPTTRVQGWAYVEEELERGLCSLAAPVVNGSGDVVAAVNVSTTTQHDESTVDRYREALLATAADISEDAAAAGVRP